jgi:hypothetical protein
LAHGDAWDELVDVFESEGVTASSVVAGVTSLCQITPASRDYHRTAETERGLPAKPA